MPARIPVHIPTRPPVRSPVVDKWATNSGEAGSPIGLLLVLTKAS